MTENTIKIAIQKSGRLYEKSKNVLNKAGIQFENTSRKLISKCENFPLEIIFLRDDDIPEYVNSGNCDLGIVGYNEYYEQLIAPQKLDDNFSFSAQTQCIKKLGFSKCRLSIAFPKQSENILGKDGKKLKIATSYPNSLKAYIKSNHISAEIIKVSGSVEITPQLGITDGICDLVSTGSTLKANGLIETDVIFESEACLIKSNEIFWTEKKNEILKKFLTRIDGVLKANSCKYLMMNAPKKSIDDITKLIPGLEIPTIIPLYGSESMVAIHVVVKEEIFWDCMEQLQALGATSILVSPIEKILE